MSVREYAFELALCARLEREDVVVGRQIGGGVRRPAGRVLDAVVVRPGPEFDRRTAITDEAIPPAAVASDVGAGQYRRVAEAFDCSPERARELAARAVKAGFFERERGGRELHGEERLRPRTRVRQVARYPDWFSTITAVENKPDLGRPGDLRRQLRLDVALGIADQVVLATASTVTGAHLNRLPEEVGVWRYEFEEGVADPGAEGADEVTTVDPKAATDRDGLAPSVVEVVREPAPLPTEEYGVELLRERPGETEIAVVSGAEKARARRRIAERTYGKGVRPDPDALPDCAHIREGRLAGGGGLPYCVWKGRTVDPGRECGPACAGHEQGTSPEVDPEAERDRRTAWVRDPTGMQRSQSGLDQFD